MIIDANSEVFSFKIEGGCTEVLSPCCHSCEIILSSGQRRKITLDGDLVYSLTKSIAQEKIHTTEAEGHFLIYKEQEESLKFLKPGFTLPNAETILNRIFNCYKESLT